MQTPPKPPPPRSNPQASSPTGSSPSTTAAISGGGVTFDTSDALAVKALGLLNEQVKARIVHYKGELETNRELDAVTAQVVAQLKAMQAAVAKEEPRQSPEELEGSQIRTLTELLQKIFTNDGRSGFASNTLKPVGKRVAKLFFESELHEKTKGDKERRIYHPEQGVFYVLQRYKNRLRAELEGFEYETDEMKAATLELLSKFERDMQVAFLSRRSPELNKVMQVFTGVLADFLQKHLPPRVDQMARVTIRNAKTARQSNSVAYKLQSDVFVPFRVEWERILMQQMVNYCVDGTEGLLSKIEAGGNEYKEETVKFFTDPQIYSTTCDVLCDALYDYLCLEGFLDLPMDWRMQMGREVT